MRAARAGLLAGLVVAIGVTGCGSATMAPPEPVDTAPTTSTTEPSTETTSGNPTATSTSTTTVPPAPSTPPPVDLEGLDLVARLVATVDAPLAMAVVPGTEKLLVAERAGTLRILTPNADDELTVGSSVLDLTHEIDTAGEGGLLGLAATDGQLFLHYTDRTFSSVVVAVPFNGEVADWTGRRVLLRQEQPAVNHNGGHLVVDDQGHLWIGFGDGGGANDPFDTAQDATTWLGSILRIDPTDGDPYGIPAGNPYPDDPQLLPEILVTGVRNPWRFSIDPHTGDLWVADVGQGLLEEVTVVPADELDRGVNLGWPAFEAGLRTGRPEPLDHRLPDLWYGHDDGRCSIVGGEVVRGPALPELAGVYVYGDFCDGVVRLARWASDGILTEEATAVTVDGLVGFGTGDGGELYALSILGGVFRIDAALPDAAG